jgi:hypothetical protein
MGNSFPFQPWTGELQIANGWHFLPSGGEIIALGSPWWHLNDPRLTSPRSSRDPIQNNNAFSICSR